jgi:hypothetical protein
MWHDVFNLSEAAALKLVVEDGLVERPGIDAAADTFARIFNLSEEAARAAARGRMTASEAQDFWDSPTSSSAGGAALSEAKRLLDSMSDAECDQLLEEQAKRRKAKKATATSKVPAKASGTRPVAVSERDVSGCTDPTHNHG